MIDEEKRQKYIILRANMYNIKQDTAHVINLYTDLLSKLKSGLLVDEKIMYNDQFNNNLEKVINVKSEISQVIASINSKL